MGRSNNDSNYNNNINSKMSWKGNDKYHWNEDTIYHFHFISSYISKQSVLEKVTAFVDIECQLEDGDTEEELVNDLMSKIYEDE
tara:strand:+ start:293 stop:544 length:252 start_codon:yes stop_codon:yes gene_type:complete